MIHCTEVLPPITTIIVAGRTRSVQCTFDSMLMVIENRDVSAVKSCWASHFKITAKCVGELDLARRPALHLEQGGAGDNYRHASSTRDSHVQPVQAVQEFHS